MEEDDDLNDLYGESDSPKADAPATDASADVTMKTSEETAGRAPGNGTGEAESGSEEDASDSESDVEFVITTKPGQRAEPPSNKPLPFGTRATKPVAASSKTEDGRKDAGDTTMKEGDAEDATATGRSGAAGRREPVPKLPNVDVDAIAQLDGKSILEIDLEALEPKPWREQGADITDYFNYGFDEFTWTAYVNKQKQIRSEFTPDKVMANMMPDPAMMMMPDPSMMGGFPGGMDPMFMQGMFPPGPGFNAGGPPPFMQQQQQPPPGQFGQGPMGRVQQQHHGRPSHSPAPMPGPPAPGFEDAKIPTGPSKGGRGRGRR